MFIELKLAAPKDKLSRRDNIRGILQLARDRSRDHFGGITVATG